MQKLIQEKQRIIEKYNLDPKMMTYQVFFTDLQDMRNKLTNWVNNLMIGTYTLIKTSLFRTECGGFFPKETYARAMQEVFMENLEQEDMIDKINKSKLLSIDEQCKEEIEDIYALNFDDEVSEKIYQKERDIVHAIATMISDKHPEEEEKKHDYEEELNESFYGQHNEVEQELLDKVLKKIDINDFELGEEDTLADVYYYAQDWVHKTYGNILIEEASLWIEGTYACTCISCFYFRHPHMFHCRQFEDFQNIHKTDKLDNSVTCVECGNYKKYPMSHADQIVIGLCSVECENQFVSKIDKKVVLGKMSSIRNRLNHVFSQDQYIKQLDKNSSLHKLSTVFRKEIMSEFLGFLDVQGSCEQPIGEVFMTPVDMDKWERVLEQERQRNRFIKRNKMI